MKILAIESSCDETAAAVVEDGRKHGLLEFTLEVRVGNKPAIRAYEKVGFESEGIRPNFYSHPKEDALIMWIRE